MATSLTDLATDVYTITNRSDLVSETVMALKSATLKAHRSDYYYKDLFETGLQFDLSLSQQTLEYKTLVPRWRALKYVRIFNYTTPPGTPGKFLTLLTPDNILDSYSVNREDVCYVAGLELQIRTCAAQQYFLLGCYLYPDITSDGYSSWIADESRFCIVYEAAAAIFKMIGQTEEFAAYNRLVQDEYAELKITNIVAVGY